MLRSYSSIASILSPWMPKLRSRRRVRVFGARRVRAVIFCEGLRVCASRTVRWSATRRGQRSSTAPHRSPTLDDPNRRRENFGRPVYTRASQPVHPARAGFAEESCDIGEEEGDEDPTADLERQRAKGIQI